MSSTTELQTWLNGTPTGGPNGDGRYPMTAKDGTVFLVYCPAAQALNPALAELPVEVFSEQAQAAATNSAASASTAEAARIAAAGSAANAASSASAAASSANSASTSATAAAGSATTASTARTNAELARDKAQMWADHPVDTVVETGKYSAKHWAQKAADSVSTGHTHTASQISDSTAAGRAILTAADAAAQRSSLGTGGLATANTWTGTNTYTQDVTIGDGTTMRNLTVQGATSGAHSGAFVGARLGSTGFVYPGVIGNRSCIIGGAYNPQGILWSNGTGLPFDVVCAEGLAVNGNTVWHAGNSAQVRAGTATGRYARWNNTAARWEEFDLFGTVANWTANVGFNQASPQRRLHIVGMDGSGGALPASVGVRNEVVYENNGNANIALVIPTGSTAAFGFNRYGGTIPGGLQYVSAGNVVRVEAGTLGASIDLAGTGLTYNSTFNIWHAGNSAQVQAGTVTGQYARWNQTTGRYEAFDLLGAANTWTAKQTFSANVGLNDAPVRVSVVEGNLALRLDSGVAGPGSTFLYVNRVGGATWNIGSWNNTNNEGAIDFRFDGGARVMGHAIWHAGNFDPSGKLNTTGGTMTGDINVVKNVPLIQMVSPSGATAAGKGYRAYANVSDANDFGLHFERWNGSAWTAAFRYQDSSLHIAGWLWSQSGAVGTQVFHHAMSWDNAVIRAATVLEPDAAYSIYEYTAAGGVPTNGIHKLRIGQDARLQNNASDAIYYGGNRVLDVSFSVPVAAGARTGQQAIWNQASGRAEFLDTAIHHIDWNTATESGWWMGGGGAANAPATMQWFIGHVLRHNGDWIVQEVWDFTQGARAVRWRRNRLNGVWQPWEQEAPLVGSTRFSPATSDVQFAASTVSGSFGGGVVMRDGSVWTGMWTQSDSTMRFGIGGSGGLAERLRINSQGLIEGFGNAWAQPGFAASENGVRRWAWYYDPAADQARIAVYDAGGGYAGDAIMIQRTTREVSDWRGSIRDTPVNAQVGNYTFTANDRGRKVLKTATNDVTYTLPAGLPIGTTIVVRNKRSTGNITIARSGTILRMAGSGTDANRTITPWGEAVLHHEEATEEWVISGTGVS